MPCWHSRVAAAVVQVTSMKGMYDQSYQSKMALLLFTYLESRDAVLVLAVADSQTNRI